MRVLGLLCVAIFVSEIRADSRCAIEARFGVSFLQVSKSSATRRGGMYDDVSAEGVEKESDARKAFQRGRRDSDERRGLRTLVINLKTREDRWHHMEQRLAPLQNNGTLAVRRLSATSALAQSVSRADVAEEWLTDRNAEHVIFFYSGSNLSLTESERGCAMSHIRAWREVADSNDQRPTLVLEDDAVLSDDFGTRLTSTLEQAQKVSGEVDMLYLGYIPAETSDIEIQPGLVQVKYVWTTVAYLLWPHGAKKLLSALPVDQPVDNFLAWQANSGRILSLAIVPKIVTQENPWDINSDIEHSDEKAGFVLQRLGRLLSFPFTVFSTMLER